MNWWSLAALSRAKKSQRGRCFRIHNNRIMKKIKRNPWVEGNEIDLKTIPSLTQEGTYALILCLTGKKTIQVGKLGKFTFPIGCYAYVGSAFGPGGLASRLKYHLHSINSEHWHIDYLRKKAELDEVWICEHERDLEHLWASTFAKMNGAAIPAPGFGSSDCKCSTHLFSFERRPLLEEFQDLIQCEFPRVLKILKVGV